MIQRDLDPLLTLSEVAAYLGLSKVHARRLLGTALPFVRLGPKTIRVRQSALRAYVESLSNQDQRGKP